MAIEVHGSTPATVANDNNSATTASFSPPAGSVVVAIAITPWIGNTMTVTDSSGGGSWSGHQQASTHTNDGVVRIAYKVFNSAPGSITVSASHSGGGTILVVQVLTGCDLINPTGATAGSNKTSNTTSYTQSITTTVAGSRVYGGAAGNANGGSWSPNGNTTELRDYSVVGFASGWAFVNSSNTTSPGSKTLGGTASSSTPGAIALLEILPQSAQEHDHDASDTLTLSDSITTTLTRATGDTLALADDVNYTNLKARTAQDTVALAESVNRETTTLPLVQITTYQMSID